MTTNNLLSKIIVFTAGATIGSLVTWKLVKTKYEQLAREEIESVKEIYSTKVCECDNETEKDSCEDSKDVEEEDLSYDDETKPFPDRSEREAYNRLVKDSGYKPNQTDTNQNSEEDDDMDKPYVIPPEEFGENDYETVSLTYYEGDGVLVDDTNEPFEEDEIEEYVVPDFAEHFGEYEDDSVFVRNDFMKTDFEILKDQRSYSEL